MQGSQLKEAVTAIQAGEVARGQRLIWQYLQTNPGDVKAWLWLVETLPEGERRLRAMEECLKRNPESEMARRAMEQLIARMRPNGEEAALAQDVKSPNLQATDSPTLTEQTAHEFNKTEEKVEFPREIVVEVTVPSVNPPTVREKNVINRAQSQPAMPAPHDKPQAAWFEDGDETLPPAKENAAQPAKPIKLHYRPSIWVWMAIILLVILVGMVIFVVVKFYLPYYLWRSGAASTTLV